MFWKLQWQVTENLEESELVFLSLAKMAPKPKSVPSRLGPPPQLAAQLGKIALVQQKQQEKFQPKMREILARQAKMLAKWAHEKMTWKKILMSWMVILVASKMVLLMLTYKFFSMTSLISLQVGLIQPIHWDLRFLGNWTDNRLLWFSLAAQFFIRKRPTWTHFNWIFSCALLKLYSTQGSGNSHMSKCNFLLKQR